MTKANTIRRFFLALGLTCLLVFSAATSWAIDTLPSGSVSPGQVLKTIIVDNYHPYTFVNEQGEADGFSVDLARAVAKAMGFTLEIRPDTWEESKRALESGSIDLLTMMAISPERDKVFDFSVPYITAYDAIFAKKGGVGFSTLKDLAGKTVLVPNKDAAHDYLLAHGFAKTMQIKPVESLPEALRQLEAGKGDAAIMPKLVGIITAKKLNIVDLEQSPPLNGYSRPFSFAVNDGNQVMVDRLNQGLNIIKTTGQYDTIYQKWFGGFEERHIDWQIVTKFGMAAAILIIVVMTWNLMLKRQVAAQIRHLEAEIAQRKLMEEALQKQNAELERFTYTVSHDLKSPLITIKSFAGSLVKDLEKGNTQRLVADLQRISTAADKMNDLLRDLLQLSRVGRIINPPEEVELNQLVGEVLTHLAGLVQAGRVSIIVQPGLPRVLCDRQRINEVLQNLVENAIKYMGAQAEPQILVGMRHAEGKDIFFVQDNGIGVEEKYQQLIFGLFNKLNPKSEGTGIGLALVKRIVEVHGGRVWVESAGLGQGSTFCFTLAVLPHG